MQAPKEFAFVSGVGGGGGGGGGGGAQPEIVGLGFEGNMFGSRSGVITMGSVGLGGKEGTAGGTVAGGAIGGGVGCGGDVFGGTEREEKRLSLQNLVDSGEGLAAGWEREVLEEMLALGVDGGYMGSVGVGVHDQAELGRMGGVHGQDEVGKLEGVGGRLGKESGHGGGDLGLDGGSTGSLAHPGVWQRGDEERQQATRSVVAAPAGGVGGTPLSAWQEAEQMLELEQLQEQLLSSGCVCLCV